MLYMDFYARVKHLAKERKLLLQELLLSVGIKQRSYYSLQQAGNLPRADEAHRIAQALGTTVEYLVSGETPAKPDATEALKHLEAVHGFLKNL